MKLRLLVLGVLVSSIPLGCAVPQKPGHGMQTHETEPRTKTDYWLYLPEDYVAHNGQHPSGGRWPLVVTFHGLRPYDNDSWQNKEWQEEADRYGFIVLAPSLRTCDTLTMIPPLTNPDAPFLKKDEAAILAVMDEVFRRTNADPNRVLATGFSSGGYIAHFMLNRHPGRFSCLAVRQADFHENLVDPAQVPRYRHVKIGIFFGENDISLCREESKRAVEWYRRYGFDVEAKYVTGLGHERTPQTAATFFAIDLGVTPKTPPPLQMVLNDVPWEAGDSATPGRTVPSVRPKPLVPPTSPTARDGDANMRGDAIYRPSAGSATGGRSDPKRVPAAPPALQSPTQLRATLDAPATPRRPIQPPYRQPYGAAISPAPRTEPRDRPVTVVRREEAPSDEIPARVHVLTDAGGHVPVSATLAVELPVELQGRVSVLWTDNGQPIGSNGLRTRALLREPGKHRIEARIVTTDDRHLIVAETIDLPVPATSTRPASGS